MTPVRKSAKVRIADFADRYRVDFSQTFLKSAKSAATSVADIEKVQPFSMGYQSAKSAPPKGGEKAPSGRAFLPLGATAFCGPEGGAV